MRESIWNRPGTSPRILASGAILVVIGLTVLLAVAEWFAAFDACLANPTCVAPASTATIEGFLALMGVGVGIVVSGAAIAAFALRPGPIGPTPSKTPYS